MRLWGRPRINRRKMLCLWLLLLALALVALGLSDLLYRDQTQQKATSLPRRPLQRLSGPSDLVEVIVDSRDAALELDVGLSPLSSLQEDQLLFVPSTQGSKYPPVPPPRKGSYKVVMPGAKKDTTGLASQTHGDMGKAVRLQLEGLDKDMELSAVQRYGFNEVVSERISLHRRLPEARHPA